ncbi:flagellar biosynthesis protein FlhF [Metasolibacillus sp.]|uniref:flagellar biosynthesis protein FlhF n=1 Tax=Metasolibacillus sp. TaxID=2703680 RepID=UPI0025F1E9B9|nr:flagellar biosynthesis protein FlhF [Metasolibacillus sp.]MCT6923564.1 flagellar biosynthesis protein FlhF [Metasolibacillus sp.]MCT6939713.1 flagellar biosynthesis protein FlhF [Metasolibacillus sp.]
MKMKKYNAPSIAEAMKLIRADLGDDAVILNSKVVVDKKFFGLVKKKSFEVVAGIDKVEAKSAFPPLQDLQLLKPIVQVPASTSVKETEQKVLKKASLEEDSAITNELKKEIADLKSIMQSLHRQSIQSKYPDELLHFIDYLKQQELNEELITQISDELFVNIKDIDSIDFENFQAATERVLERKLRDVEIGGVSYDKKYINVLGPTGVGKTTTIAKMAARAVLEKKKKVGFITTDTYRIAAIEQLKTYAGLLQVPIEIVYSAEDYKAAIEKFAHLDLVFIDTAGRNYKEAKYITDLQQLIKFGDNVQTFLVLSLTSKEQDLDVIIKQFEQIHVEKFIFTKLDETNSIGTMFNLMIKYKKGLAYYTNGQEVPEDIEEPSLEKMFELFFRGEIT